MSYKNKGPKKKYHLLIVRSSNVKKFTRKNKKFLQIKFTHVAFWII